MFSNPGMNPKGKKLKGTEGIFGEGEELMNCKERDTEGR
jgi:hypothetical protein